MRLFPGGCFAPMLLIALGLFPLLLPAPTAALAAGGAPSERPGGPAQAGQNPPLPLLDIDLPHPEVWKAIRGLDLDLVDVRPGRRARALGWPGTEARLREAGITYRRLSDDYGRDLARRNGTAPAAGERIGATAGAWNVPPLGQGSLAGYWTFDEVAALLDSVAATDSRNLVTAVDTLGLSVLGEPVLAVGITDRSRPLGTRPEVLFTALTHAREPQGMQVVLYFLSRLLDGYEVDPEITYLIREREIWFVPIVNPDGYLMNQNTWETTGSYGFWRKNLRNNDGNPATGSRDGVDLNRNFGFQWGYDNIGSSSNISSQTYRGPAPFSEPETQVLRDFCLAHTFRTAENYHTFWEACLYPWGYVAADAPDAATFIRLADAMMREAHYAYGRSAEILYPVNGEANDWMYGDLSKPKVISFTTEVGTQDDGFWPSPSRILPLAELNYRANVVLAYAASVYLAADSLEVDGPGAVLVPGETRTVRFLLRHEGTADSTAGSPVVQVTSLDPAVSVLAGQVRFPVLGPGDAAWPLPGEGIVLHAGSEAAPGTAVPLLLEFGDEGAYYGRDTLVVRLGEPLVVFSDGAGNGLAGWTAQGTWGTEAENGDPAFSDSPGSAYLAATDASLAMSHDLDLSGAVHAVLRFRTQWDIETGYDFARVEASVDSGATWIPLEGGRTRPGHGTAGGYAGGTQPLGTPGYDGNQRFWTAEEIDLGDFAGVTGLRLRFRLTSDVGTEKDGWHLDDLAVLAYAGSVSAAPGDEAALPPLSLTAFPNPLRERAGIVYSLPAASPVRVAVHDVTGREVRVISEGLAGPGRRETSWDGRDAQGRPVASGAYFLRLTTGAGASATKIFVVR